MNLPAPCPECAPYQGAWMATENGMKRCQCPRGQILAKPPVKAAAQPPVIPESSATLYAEMLAGGMRFYPAEAAARALIGDEIAGMCNSDAEARWLVLEMHRRYDGREWPGVTVMRALHCSRHDPRDGILAISAEIEELQEREYVASLALPPADLKQLTAAPSIAATISDLALAKDLNRTGPRPKVREIPVVQITDKNRITEADIARAVAEVREQRARGAVGLV